MAIFQSHLHLNGEIGPGDGKQAKHVLIEQNTKNAFVFQFGFENVCPMKIIKLRYGNQFVHAINARKVQQKSLSLNRKLGASTNCAAWLDVGLRAQQTGISLLVFC